MENGTDQKIAMFHFPIGSSLNSMFHFQQYFKIINFYW